MRYLVTAKVKPGQSAELRKAIAQETLGQGSIAEGEYLRNMSLARQRADGRVQWVEVCFCSTPIAEERPYWEEYFDLLRVQDAHPRSKCRDWNGSEPWACGDCDCTARLEQRMETWGASFSEALEADQD
ncbi:MAG TPA: hypothetical protein VHR17_15770 [Thermoanaerobaculia bacterium]|jgi:hypothetical protein|nr:hypothetical protein [Thermoanaerobaculia bacterium]